MRILAVFTCLLSAVSCTERLLYVKGDPDEATVYINGNVAGKTPLRHKIDVYGNYDILVVKENYKSYKVRNKFRAPWYQYPILDFITDVLIPFKIRDVRKVKYNLEPARDLQDDSVNK